MAEQLSLFGDLDVRLDPWSGEYGAGMPLGGFVDSEAEEVDVSVEDSVGAWEAKRPASEGVPERVVFVDGVRRTDARIVVRSGNSVRFGIFGSYGVGAVRCEGGQALVSREEVDRIVVCGGGEALPHAVATGPGLVYRPMATASEEPDAPRQKLLREMRRGEERLGYELADEAGTLVVADGPLTFVDPVKGAVCGYIKRVYSLYLPEELHPVLFGLPAGLRTPLFAMTESRFRRYSWFLRLADPRPGESHLAGLVRLEVSESVGVKRARKLADETTLLLPRFIPSPAREERYPQNLLPIGALERRLRRRLGHPGLIGRKIAELLAKEEPNVETR